MKRLSKEQLKERSDIIQRLAEAKAEVEEKVEAVNAAIVKYNEALADASTLRDDWVAEMETYLDERSEKWQECKGSAYQDWKELYEGASLDEISEIEVPDMSHGDEFEAIDEQPSE